MSLMASDLAEIQDVMNFFDTRGDGRVAVAQVDLCLRALGLVPTQRQIATLTQQWPNDDTRLTIEEFTPLYKDLRKERGCGDRSADELADCLANFDRDGNGLVNVHDLRFVLTNCGEKLSEEEAELLLHGLESSEGKVDIHDFIRLLLSNW